RTAKQRIQRMVNRTLRKMNGGSTVTPLKVFSESLQVRVKSVAEGYDRSTKAFIAPSEKDGRPSHHPYAGRPVQYMGRILNEPSEFDYAVRGAFVKALVQARWGRNTPIPSAL